MEEPARHDTVEHEAASAARPRRRWRARLWIYGSIFAAFYGFYLWQPLTIQLFPNKPPALNWIDPAEARLFQKGTKVLVITAHPDDSEFYCAPLLMRLRDSGAELRHLLETDGDKAYYFWADNRDLHATRRAEQTEASHQWNAQSITFLGFPDGRLRNNDETIRKTAEVISRVQPDYILAFDPEYPSRVHHQDHRVSGEIAVDAAKKVGYRGWFLGFATVAPNYVADVSKYYEWQRKLVSVHRSQFYGERLERIVRMTESRRFEDGELKGYEFGVALRCFRLEQ